MNAPLSPKWAPSRNQQAAQWWARFLTRYLIGCGGLAWEILVDKGKNATLIMVCGGLIGLPDVLGYRSFVKAQAQTELEDREDT